VHEHEDQVVVGAGRGHQRHQGRHQIALADVGQERLTDALGAVAHRGRGDHRQPPPGVLDGLDPQRRGRDRGADRAQAGGGDVARGLGDAGRPDVVVVVVGQGHHVDPRGRDPGQARRRGDEPHPGAPRALRRAVGP
jgi:hypothetical protein